MALNYLQYSRGIRILTNEIVDRLNAIERIAIVDWLSELTDLSKEDIHEQIKLRSKNKVMEMFKNDI